jgi:2-keto-4-pentenoate hydratase/2-oxohepta-3-ene-1,7-dioic acid hydratase in catechol pathway
MRICRFTLNADAEARPRLGLMEEAGIRDITAVTESLPALRWPLPLGDQLIDQLGVLRPKMEQLAHEAPLIPRDAVRLLSPVANPGKFICGLGNWSHHKAPLGLLGFLFKVTSAVAGEGEGVQVRWPDRVTLHEPELGIIIGKECTNVTEADALSYVAGYCCALDTTLKQEKEDYSFCKSFDTYGTLGPCLVTADEIADPSELSYRFWVNGELRGERDFRDLTASPAQLVAYASTAMRLHPGDVILSGAADVGPVAPGDVMRLEIPRVGRIDVPVLISPLARRIKAIEAV